MHKDSFLRWEHTLVTSDEVIHLSCYAWVLGSDTTELRDHSKEHTASLCSVTGEDAVGTLTEGNSLTNEDTPIVRIDGEDSTLCTAR